MWRCCFDLLHRLATQSSNLPECKCTKQPFPFSINDAVNLCRAGCAAVAIRQLHDHHFFARGGELHHAFMPVSTGGAFNKSTPTRGIRTKAARSNLPGRTWQPGARMELYMHPFRKLIPMHMTNFKWLNITIAYYSQSPPKNKRVFPK